MRDAAQQMISASDNMATDLLIGRLGTRRVERALADRRPPRPASMTPFPTMHELFSVGWGTAGSSRTVEAGRQQGRAQLLQQTNSRPYEPDPNRTHTPASDSAPSGTAAPPTSAGVHAALQKSAVGEAAPVRTSCPPSRESISTEPSGPTSAPRPATCRGPDLQLVCRRPHRAAVGGELPTELAAVPQQDRGGLADIGGEAGIRATPNRLNQGSTAASRRAPGSA